VTAREDHHSELESGGGPLRGRVELEQAGEPEPGFTFVTGMLLVICEIPTDMFADVRGPSRPAPRQKPSR
jgi:hypothetical protein